MLIETKKEFSSLKNKKFLHPSKQNENIKKFKKSANEILKEITKTGLIPENIDWTSLNIFLQIKLKDECILMNDKYPDLNDNYSANENFDDLLKEILELLESFKKKYFKKTYVYFTEIM